MRNPFGNFKIYPRGFLGAMMPTSLQKKPSNQSWRAGVSFDVSIFEPNDSKIVTVNPEIENFYAAFIRKDLLERDFDFREDVLRTVLNAFGTKSFEAWYLAQLQSPSFGDMHRRFLDDCINFFVSGKRDLSIQTWDSLIDSSDEPLTDPKLSERAQRFFYGKKFVSELSQNGNPTIVEVVHDWISKPGGFSDLLITAHILFGNKN